MQKPPEYLGLIVLGFLTICGDSALLFWLFTPEAQYYYTTANIITLSAGAGFFITHILLLFKMMSTILAFNRYCRNLAIDHYSHSKQAQSERSSETKRSRRTDVVNKVDEETPKEERGFFIRIGNA